MRACSMRRLVASQAIEELKGLVGVQKSVTGTTNPLAAFGTLTLFHCATALGDHVRMAVRASEPVSLVGEPSVVCLGQCSENLTQFANCCVLTDFTLQSHRALDKGLDACSNCSIAMFATRLPSSSHQWTLVERR
eukprot:m.874496 g.874496  ORF g.874496 m.874496 type:complete len:135 (-) comp59800_c1_seq2:3360-3764(-)